MKLKTRDFGEIEIDEKDIVKFVQPIFGFEGYKNFVFLYQEDISKHFIWLQSTEDQDLCFILVDPGLITEQYQPQITPDIVKALGDDSYMCWLMTSIREPFEESTVNLRSPIIINPNQHTAIQIILDQDLPIRYPLFQKEEKTC